MKIWIFNNYNMLPSQGGLNRHYFFAKQLQKMGHEPAVFVGSHPHNTNLQMIEGKEPFRLEPAETFPWVYVKTENYEGSKLKRIISMFQYYRNAKKAAEAMVMTDGIPEVVIGSSAHPLAAVLAIRLGQKLKCKSIVEIRDLWPESIVAYGIAGAHNPAVLILRWLEKWIYQKADAVIFTMEGAYNYILEQGWEEKIPRSKVFYVNNGVNLEEFHYNRDHYKLEDEDLDNPEFFKVVYTGSIRQANNLGLVLDAAKQITNQRICFLIWGDGEQVASLRQRLIDENITNVKFKGKVEKKFIPSIVSRANLNLMHLPPHRIFNYGISPNKLFDYLAAEKPVLCDFPCAYNPAVQRGAGVLVENATPSNIASVIEQIEQLSPDAYQAYCESAKRTAEQYDFKCLAQKLIDIVERV